MTHRYIVERSKKMDNSKNSNMGTQTWLDVFIENLNLLIKENNLNKNKLAKECEVPYPTLSSWYGKKNYPNTDSLLKLADFFDVSLDWLVGRSNQREVEKRIEYELNTEPTYGQIMELVEFLYEHGIVMAQDPCIAGDYDDTCDAAIGGVTPEIMAVTDDLLICAIKKYYYYKTSLSKEMYQNNVKIDIMDKLKGKRIVHLDHGQIYDLYCDFKKKHGDDVLKFDLEELWKTLHQEEERLAISQEEKDDDEKKQDRKNDTTDACNVQ